MAGGSCARIRHGRRRNPVDEIRRSGPGPTGQRGAAPALRGRCGLRLLRLRGRNRAAGRSTGVDGPPADVFEDPAAGLQASTPIETRRRRSIVDRGRRATLSKRVTALRRSSASTSPNWGFSQAKAAARGPPPKSPLSPVGCRGWGPWRSAAASGDVLCGANGDAPLRVGLGRYADDLPPRL